MTDIGYNVQIVMKNKEISSTAHPHSELQKDLVFELQRNGTVNYWFKKDYLESADKIVTGPDGQNGLSHTILPSDKLHLKHLYTNGTWTANFKDSTIKIDFGKNDFLLPPLEGKYTTLGAGSWGFQQKVYYDSLYNGRTETFKKIINAYFESY